MPLDWQTILKVEEDPNFNLYLMIIRFITNQCREEERCSFTPCSSVSFTIRSSRKMCLERGEEEDAKHSLYRGGCVSGNVVWWVIGYMARTHCYLISLFICLLFHRHTYIHISIYFP